MPKSAATAPLETRTARLKLPVTSKPLFVRVGNGVGLGYRRNRNGAGFWVLRVTNGRGGYVTSNVAPADDIEPANGSSILDYWQAREAARIAGGTSLEEKKAVSDALARPLTVWQALERYEAELKIRGGDLGNVRRIRWHFAEDGLGSRPVAKLTPKELVGWRDSLAKERRPASRDTLAEPLTAASINRTLGALKAALNLAADRDTRITNRSAWKIGLAALPGAAEPRNTILPDQVVRQLVVEASMIDPAFGLLVEVAAVTGARIISQIGKLRVADLQQGQSPRLMMPASKKGRGQKAILRRPVPISADLASRLAAAARGRLSSTPLLLKADSTPWGRGSHLKLFIKLVRQCGLPNEVTSYALRHSAIVRELLAGVPTRVVAAGHDTSVLMIERNYSAFISDHADALTRGAMLDISPDKGAGYQPNALINKETVPHPVTEKRERASGRLMR